MITKILSNGIEHFDKETRFLVYFHNQHHQGNYLQIINQFKKKKIQHKAIDNSLRTKLKPPTQLPQEINQPTPLKPKSQPTDPKSQPTTTQIARPIAPPIHCHKIEREREREREKSWRKREKSQRWRVRVREEKKKKREERVKE